MSDLPITGDIDLRSSYFDLFAIPVRYELERATIQGRYLELQRIVHPDRFADFGERGQRLAMQYAAFVNQAFDTLCSPLKRALYLLELSGHPVDLEKNTVVDGSFLMEQIALREQLSLVHDSTEPEAVAEALRTHAQQLMDRLQADFSRFWGSGEDSYTQAADCARKMHFVDRLLTEVEQTIEDIDDH